MTEDCNNHYSSAVEAAGTQAALDDAKDQNRLRPARFYVRQIHELGGKLYSGTLGQISLSPKLKGTEKFAALQFFVELVHRLKRDECRDKSAMIKAEHICPPAAGAVGYSSLFENYMIN